MRREGHRILNTIHECQVLEEEYLHKTHTNMNGHIMHEKMQTKSQRRNQKIRIKEDGSTCFEWKMKYNKLIEVQNMLVREYKRTKYQ